MGARKRPDTLQRRTSGPARVADKVAAALERIPGPDRTRLLALAGYDERKLIELLQKALTTIEGKLSALVVDRRQVQTSPGSFELKEFYDQDTSAQLRAATELLSFLGVYPSKSSPNQGNSGATTYNIVILGSEAEPQHVEAEVIDVPQLPASTAL